MPDEEPNKRRLQVKKPTEDRTGVETKIVNVAPGTTPMDLRRNLKIPDGFVAFCRAKNPPALDDGADLFKELADNAVIEFVPASPVAEEATANPRAGIIGHQNDEIDITPLVHDISPSIDCIIKPSERVIIIVPKGTTQTEMAFTILLSEELISMGWNQTGNGYRGFVEGSGYRLHAILKRRYGDVYDLLVYDPPAKLLGSVKGACFKHDFGLWRKVNFGLRNQPALSLIRETEYVLKTWG